MAIPPKQAVQAAIRFIRDLQEGTPPEDVAVEEVEMSDDQRVWHITIGYNPPGSSMAKITGQEVHRQYKIFKVNALTSEVISMKLREL